MQNYRDAAGIWSPAKMVSGKFISGVLSLVLVGGFFQGYACGTMHATVVSLIFVITGSLVVYIVHSGKKPEMQTFLLTYGIAIFAGGAAQSYSLFFFHDPQSTIDAHTFLEQISPSPPFTTMENMPAFNSPLAIIIWQQIYKLTWWLGIDFGPYIAVMFNALVMGLTGSFTVRTARELYGPDNRRLIRVGIFFAFCGMFIMFGAILLRDCFTTFFNALVIYGLIRFIVRKSISSFIFAVFLTAISAYAMVYLRMASVVMFGLYVLLAFGLLFVLEGMSKLRLFFSVFLIAVISIAIPYILNYIELFDEIQLRGMQSYSDAAAAAAGSEGSLGFRLVINQPFPIRILLGSGVLLLNPIPLWAGFDFALYDSHWIKSYNGFFQLFVVPFVVAGFSISLRNFRQDRKLATGSFFLVIYLAINMIAVVATSLEQRHFAQFMPAFMILAALPDTHNVLDRTVVKKISVWWFSTVIIVHLGWVVLKGF